MKKILFPVLFVAFSIGVSSCQKCVECDNCPFGITGDACMDEFDSKEDYEAAVANAEALGCSCTEKLKGK
ncbi:MAG: hypothetical protein H6602_11530 [Flavobacteriales bacterium]|nr:hypothetical protein [Flavobacteriales bacterium]